MENQDLKLGIEELFADAEQEKQEKPPAAITIAEESESENESYKATTEEEETESVTDENNISSEGSAAAMVNALAFISSAGCSAFIGRPRLEYKMDEDEKSEIAEPLAQWFAIMGKTFHPAYAFFLALIVIIGGKSAEAWQHKKDDDEERDFLARREEEKRRESINAERLRRESLIAAGQTMTPAPDRIEPLTFGESSKTAKRRITRTKRKQYQVDAKGFYERDEKGNYLQSEDRTTRPTANELRIIEEQNALGKSKGEINAELRKYNNID